MKFIVPLALVFAIALPSAALASSPSSAGDPVATAAAFSKTRFVFDVGTASYAIHHFIYAPFRAGKLHGVKAYLKAAAAAVYAVHALRSAYRIANSGNSKLLHVVVSPLNGLIGTLSSVGSRVRHGDTRGIAAANAQDGVLSGAAARGGAPFKDVPVAI